MYRLTAYFRIISLKCEFCCVAFAASNNPTWQNLSSPVILNSKATVVTAGISGTNPDTRYVFFWK